MSFLQYADSQPQRTTAPDTASRAAHSDQSESSQSLQRKVAQLAGIEEEEPLQGKFNTAQLQTPEEEEPLQG